MKLGELKEQEEDRNAYFRVERHQFLENQSLSFIDLSRHIRNQESLAEYTKKKPIQATNDQNEGFPSSSSAFSKIQSELLPYEQSMDNKDTIIMQRIEEMPKLSKAVKNQIQNQI